MKKFALWVAAISLIAACSEEKKAEGEKKEIQEKSVEITSHDTNIVLGEEDFELVLREEHEGDPFLEKAIPAINAEDYGELEYLRDELTPENTVVLLSYWSKNHPWHIKDAYVHILMDQDKELVGELMEDALNSPTIESIAYALYILGGDDYYIDEMLSEDFWIDEDKVKVALEKYRNEQK